MNSKPVPHSKLTQTIFCLALLLLASSQLATQLLAQDSDASEPIYNDASGPIFPLSTWERYNSEEEALDKAENATGQARVKAAISLFLLSRDAFNDKNKKKGLELALKASDLINSIYRRKRNDMFLAMMSGQINLNVANQTDKLKDRIRFTNRGLANFAFAMPNIPNNLEAMVIYLHTTIYIPKFFKDLSSEQLQQINLFLEGYHTAMAKLSNPKEKDRLEELRSHLAILAAKVASDNKNAELPKYLNQVDTRFFPRMKAEGNGDLVVMYQALKSSL